MKKILTATDLKYIAIAAMTTDHIAYSFLLPESAAYFLMRLFGRLTAPIMAFFIAEGFVHTKSRRKYFLRLLTFAVISQPFYFFMIYSRPPETALEFLTTLNVMFTFCLSLLALIFISTKKLPFTVRALLIGVCFATADICDWSFFIPAWTIVFYVFRNDNRKKTAAFIGVTALLMILRYWNDTSGFISASYQLGVVLALIPLTLYNGERCRKSEVASRTLSKWFFYAYYPLHIAVIVLVKFCLAGA